MGSGRYLEKTSKNSEQDHCSAFWQSKLKDLQNKPNFPEGRASVLDCIGEEAVILFQKQGRLNPEQLKEFCKLLSDEGLEVKSFAEKEYMPSSIKEILKVMLRFEGITNYTFHLKVLDKDLKKAGAVIN